MAEERDLERRAVEELLGEAARARVRAETMGAVGWAKCPLHSTNKRFLLNTLRTTTLQHRSGGTGASQSEAREPRDGRQGVEPRSRRPQRVRRSDHDRSRSPAVGNDARAVCIALSLSFSLITKEPRSVRPQRPAPPSLRAPENIAVKSMDMEQGRGFN
ncbi:hypothetical protein AAFF_G00091790 [Aldrovandia affinis]|uniref:Uncharacterized protein n=1 Tax=Aldrovandia affinis TaxID=143900 RepID=A0AAD7T2K1_9TELE|nr:hypothetical protein AAFF_G00091790 [Aldrovandia affinis]